MFLGQRPGVVFIITNPWYIFTNRDCCYFYKTINRVSKKVITPNVLLFSNYVNSVTPFLLNTEIIY